MTALDPVDPVDKALLGAIEDGLPIVSRPYARVAEAIGIGEEEVIERLRRLVVQGIVRRLGLVVRHRAVGFVANAMAVWDVPDETVDERAAELAKSPCVTLCYRRPRRLPEWPYNLFCMVHGRERETVRAQIAELAERAGLGACPNAVLFSTRCFKQRGARFSRQNEAQVP